MDHAAMTPPTAAPATEAGGFAHGGVGTVLLQQQRPSASMTAAPTAEFRPMPLPPRDDKPKRARPARAPAAAAAPAAQLMSMTQLIEYLANGAVTELVVVEIPAARGTYRLEAALSWKSGVNVLGTARYNGGPRVFRRIDTLVNALRSMGVGNTIIRLEIQP